VLWAIENHIRDNKSENLPQPSLLEVEHVLPKAWGDNWNPAPELDKEAANRRNWIKNTLGNLTLITKHLKINLSNRPWTDPDATGLANGGEAGKGKRTLLREYSLLRLSKELTHENPESWDESTIDKRGKLMTKRICEVWPGPPRKTAEDRPAATAVEPVEIEESQPAVTETKDNPGAEIISSKADWPGYYRD